MLQQTFMQKVTGTVFAGLAAACLLWVFRHFVEQAFYESSNEGWREMYKHSTPGSTRR